MALRLVRQTSETPNITNKDDTIMTRYAYGGYNGVVKAFGNELDYNSSAGSFRVLDGRIVLDGWEVDVDGAGWLLNLSTVTGIQYHSVYLEINVLTETATITSTYLTGVYPEIEKGDDLTATPNGTARLLLYNLKVQNGTITEIVKRFEIVPYLAQRVIDTQNDLSELKTNLKNGNVSVKVAEYASNDTSKGTIEDRLTNPKFNIEKIFGSTSGDALISSNSTINLFSGFKFSDFDILVFHTKRQGSAITQSNTIYLPLWKVSGVKLQVHAVHGTTDYASVTYINDTSFLFEMFNFDLGFGCYLSVYGIKHTA